MLNGLITERDLDEIEAVFPGIWHYYLALDDKPATFLELMWQYEAKGATGCEAACGEERVWLGGDARNRPN